MDSDIGNFEKKGTRRKIVCFVCGFGHYDILSWQKSAKGMRKMPQTRRMAAQTVCHFSHNADFCQLRISKYPANAHKTNYFSALVIGCFD